MRRRKIEDLLANSLVVHPGDTLLVRIANKLTLAQAVAIRTGIEGYLPGIEVVIVNADQFAVDRPEATP